MKLEQDIKQFTTAFQDALKKASTQSQLEEVRVQFLGRQGTLTQLMDQLKQLSVEERKIYGPQLNGLKAQATAAFEEKQKNIESVELEYKSLKKKSFDVTAYKPGQLFGSLHPYSHVIAEIEDIFTSMGFAIADGPEMENEYYNFTGLNIPQDHPARDMHDTFWLSAPDMLLRTHTSNVQVRVMESSKPPIAVIAPGRVYRHEATDASHDFMFMQTEGIVIDKNISMAHLLGTAQTFLRAFFEKKDLEIRIRPGYFPFVEPGIEIDMSCPFCKTGCSVCKKTRWIEIFPCGLIHPNVLSLNGIDPSVYSGFAFGFGMTRVTMLKYGIPDIRLLHSSKLDFLRQF
jgi:phenylalanyl-tRNA synthetase alpha chain